MYIHTCTVLNFMCFLMYNNNENVKINIYIIIQNWNLFLLAEVCIGSFVNVAIFKGEVQKHKISPLGFLERSKEIQLNCMTRKYSLPFPLTWQIKRLLSTVNCIIIYWYNIHSDIVQSPLRTRFKFV